MNRGIGRQFQQATAEVLRTLGQSFDVDRHGEHHTVQGHRDATSRHIKLLHDADVQDGDILTSKASGEAFHVIHVERPVVGETVTSTEAKYETPAQRQQRLAAEQWRDTPTFSIGTVQGSIVGTQQHAQLTVTFDQRALSADIDRRGGDDSEALKAMVAEIHEMLDDRDKISKGSLVKYSELLERHSWITGAVAQAVLGWATGSLKI